METGGRFADAMPSRMSSAKALSALAFTFVDVKPQTLEGQVWDLVRFTIAHLPQVFSPILPEAFSQLYLKPLCIHADHQTAKMSLHGG